MQNLDIWFERKFSFDFPVELYPMIVERLRGTPARLEEKLEGLAPDVLKRALPGGWSIQQQAGHLLMVESLWWGRLDDFLNGEKTLRPADTLNRRTKENDFHAQPIADILESFRAERTTLGNRLYHLNIEQAGMVALHPRLNQPMRLIDAYYFAAEHDDHHLARMTDLINSM
jgi:hypothetical protein